MIGWLMSNKLERMWEEAVVTYFEVPSRNFPRGTELLKASVIFGLRGETQTRDFTYTKLQYYPIDLTFISSVLTYRSVLYEL
jgi:hypothetical protein